MNFTYTVFTELLKTHPHKEKKLSKSKDRVEMHKSIRTILKHELKMSTVVFDISERKGIFYKLPPPITLLIQKGSCSCLAIDRSARCDIKKNGRKFDEVFD